MRKATSSVAIYARVSSDRQAEAGTVESQVAELKERIRSEGLTLPMEGCFIDEGYSGATLVRPALERLRDLAANGGVDIVYVHSPDRLARKYAYQVLLTDEFQRAGVEVVFLNRPVSQTPEDDLLLQVQGMVAEYERAKIMERSRRGKRHAASQGRVSALGGAPYGYRYIDRHEGGGEARYEVLLEEARVVQQVFEWVGRERVSIGEVCKRLNDKGIRTRTGKRLWSRSTIHHMLNNPAYRGKAAFGKTRSGVRRPRLRPRRGCPEQPKKPFSSYIVSPKERVEISVPAIVDEDLFEAVGQQLEENKKRYRQSSRGASYLLQGLLVCKRCGYSYYGKPVSWKTGNGEHRKTGYYRCLGSDSQRFGGELVCENPQIQIDKLDAAVWKDVCALLSEPQRVEREYRRRLTRGKRGPGWESIEQLESRIQKTKRGISRVVDAYAESFLEKEDFESRVTRLRERLATLTGDLEKIVEQETEKKEIELIIGQIQEFADRVNTNLQEADWTMRRDLIRTLVKRVEIDQTQINIVYRVSPCPFESSPHWGTLQLCTRSHSSRTRGEARALDSRSSRE